MNFKSIFVFITVIAFSYGAPIDNQIVSALQKAGHDYVNQLGSLFANGIDEVIQFSQNSKEDQSGVLHNYLDCVSKGVYYVKEAQGDDGIPPQLSKTFASLREYVGGYKAPNQGRSYDAHALDTHQTGKLGNSEGRYMETDLANDVNGLIQSHSAAGSIYKAYDRFDRMANGVVSAMGNFLAPITDGASKTYANYLNGPQFQTLTHGYYDTIAHMFGGPVDRITGQSELSPADTQVEEAKAQVHAKGTSAKATATKAIEGYYYDI